MEEFNKNEQGLDIEHNESNLNNVQTNKTDSAGSQQTEPAKVIVDSIPLGPAQPVPQHTAPAESAEAQYTAPVQQPAPQYAASEETAATQYSVPAQEPVPQYTPQYTAPVQQPAPQYTAPAEQPVQQYNAQSAQPEQPTAQYTTYGQPVSQYKSQSGQGDSYSNDARQQARGQVYYNESVKKTKSKKSGVGQLILVAVLSSVIGGGIVFAAMTFLSPVIQPAINSMLGRPAESTEVAVGSDNGVYKKVEITQSSTPVEAISEKVSPSIVGIQVTVKSQFYGFFSESMEDGVGEGSGIIIREDGYILTNNHVVEDALQSNSSKLSEGSKIEVILPSDTSKAYPATVVGRDSKTDIAVLKIDANNLPAAELGDSDQVKSGELAVAIGNPGGIDYMGSVTAGIISGINRSITMDNGQTLKLLQTDAAINPGNSGGALVNSQGQVIGVNTVKIAATGYEGLGFAIPINEANEIAESLMEYKYVKGRPYLGVSINTQFDESIAKRNNVPNGLLVAEVVPLGAAYNAGIQANDIITKFDGVAITTFDELETQKNKHKPGDKVEVEVYRVSEGKSLKLTVTLDEEKNTD